MQRKSTLSTLQVRHPATLLIVAGLLTLLAVGYALRLRVLTGFESLLPESRPSVQELKRVASLGQAQENSEKAAVCAIIRDVGPAPSQDRPSDRPG